MDNNSKSPFSLFGNSEEPDDVNPNGSRDDLERWLDMLRDQAGDEWKPAASESVFVPANAENNAASELPDWLADIAPRTEETNVDFLQSFAREIDDKPTSESPISATSALLGGSEPVVPAPAPVPSEPKSDRPVPDWLKGSSNVDTSSPIATGPVKAESGGLGSLLDDAPGVIAGGATTSSLDWLSGVATTESSTLPTSPPVVTDPLPQAQPKPITQAMPAVTAQPTPPVIPEPATEANESLLDWLIDEDEVIQSALAPVTDPLTTPAAPVEEPVENTIIRQTDVSDDDFLAQSDWLLGPTETVAKTEKVAEVSTQIEIPITPEPKAKKVETSDDFTVPDWMDSAPFEPLPPLPEQKTDSDRHAGLPPIGASEGLHADDPDTGSWLPDLGKSAPMASTNPESDLPDWLTAPTGFTEPLPPAQAPKTPFEPAEELPDWLNGDAATPDAVASPAQLAPIAEPIAQDALPDWLPQEPEPVATPAAPVADALPDWLPQETADPDPFAAAAAAPAPVEDNAPDWLKATSELNAAAVEDDLPDWLKAQTGSLEAPAPMAQPDPVAQNDLPDWLQGAHDAAVTPDAAPAPVDNDISSWLADTGAQSIEIEPMESSPDWLKDATRPAPASENAGKGLESVEDALARTSPTPAEPAGVVAATPAPGATSPTDTPDWLSQISDTGQFEWEDLEGTEAEANAPAAFEALPPIPVDGEAQSVADTTNVPAPWETQVAPAAGEQDWVIELPGWLQPEEGAKAAAEAAQPVPDQNLEAKAKLEDALDSIPRGEAAPEANKFDDTIFSALQDDESEGGELNLNDLPEWLKPAEKQTEEEELDMPPWLRPTSADDIEWLNTLAPGTVPPLRTPAITPSTQDDVDFIISAEAANPEWLEATGPGNMSSVSTQPAVSPISTPGDLPDWLASVRPADLSYGSTATPQAERTTTTAMELFPEAVAEPVVSPAQPVAPAPAPAYEVEAKKAPASSGPAQPLEQADFPEIPPWLESLRPANEVDAPPEERSSPFDKGSAADFLDEISGALPVAPIITEQATVGTIAAEAEVQELVVTDAQAKQAAIFEELFAPVAKTQTEPLPQALPKQARTFQLDRVLVALALFVPLAFTFWFQPAWLGQPAIESRPATKAFYDAANAITPGSEVLVVFDYEPGTSADVDPSMEAVIAHLAQNGVRIAVVAAKPAAVDLAVETVQRAKLSVDANFVYNYGQDWVHLGYLPGGALGAQSLAAAPQTTLPIEIMGGLNPWEGMLRNVRTFNQFELVVVGAGSAERTRAWVEQVEVYDVPIGAVVPAGAEPLVLPYYESETPQLIGVISGVSGASVYDTLNNRASGLLRTWSVYSFGILLSAVLLFFGSIIWLITDLMAGQTKNKADFAQIQKGLDTEGIS